MLGAGIQGCCLALALARRGVTVDLLDQHPAPLLGASTNNEGKLHLGFVYAGDPNHATHDLMIRGSLSFASIIALLTGADPHDYAPRRRFHYAVPHDSQLTPDEVEAHFEAVEAALLDYQAASSETYLGRRLDRCYRRCSDDTHGRLFAQGLIAAAFETVEEVVFTLDLAAILRGAIVREPKVRFRGGVEVTAVELGGATPVRVFTRGDGRDAHDDYEAAANCLWDGRLTVDQSAGIVPERSWLFRYKAMVRVRDRALAGARIPSATLILGAYGDVVNYGDGDFYISWYPAFKLGETDGNDGRVLHRLLEQTDRGRMAREGIVAMAAYVPGVEQLLAGLGTAEVGGGVIFAWGATDIDDCGSMLHQRSMIGPQYHGTYITIDTGKYCMAPLFAEQVAGMLADLL